MKKVIITGAHGFLGRHTAALFKQKGFKVIGIGHGHWSLKEPANFGIDTWIESDIDLAGLSLTSGPIDCVVHCAGSGSVGQSVIHPFDEFKKTVDSTLHVLEFIRTEHPHALLVYPSSAAVYGDQPDVPISEACELKPVSPYGFNKKITEELIYSYHLNFNISATIIRFFSLYGAGLEKQLLWDGCLKLLAGEEKTTFWGSGKETRDWLHVKDASSLIYYLAAYANGFNIFNGGSGTKLTVKEILSILVCQFGVNTELIMGGEVKVGDPNHYWADISKIMALGWAPQYKIVDGLQEYVRWFRARKQFC